MKILYLIPILFLSGCAMLGTTPSQQYAGVSSAEIKPILNDDGQVIASHIDIKLGKEYKSLFIDFHKDTDGTIDVTVQADQVGAFIGQKISADQMQALNEEALKLSEKLGPIIMRRILGLP